MGFADRQPIDDILSDLDAASNLVLVAPLAWPYAPGVLIVGAGSAFFMAWKRPSHGDARPNASCGALGLL